MTQPETGGVKRNIDIRDEQFKNTQREDWLLPTEPRHGARPRQSGGECPPGNRKSSIQGCGGNFRRPASE